MSRRLYYCPIKTDLNVGIKELKADNNVEDFLRFLNKEGNGNQTLESSDECYSSVKKFDYLDFHTKGEENVVIKNLTTQDPFLNKLCSNHGTFRGFINEPIPVDQEQIEDPDDANIDPIFKIKRGVSYPKHDPTIPWNEMQPVLCMRNVEDGRCAGMYNNNKNAVQKKLFDDSPKSDKKSKPVKKTMPDKKCKHANKAAMPSDKVSLVKKGRPVKKGIPVRKSVSFSPNVITRSKNSGEGCSRDGEGWIRDVEKSPQSLKWTRSKIIQVKK
ncbi:hypothetical protein Tco_1376338 [Tanacetum coccineum]